MTAIRGHDWVFASEVVNVFGNPVHGDVPSLKDGKDRLIGSAIYNSKSQIVARRFSRRKQILDLKQTRLHRESGVAAPR